MVGVTGLEPVTPRLSSACSNQLSYTPDPFLILDFSFSIQRTANAAPSQIANQKLKMRLVELRRLELPTYSLQSYRSTN